MDNLDDSNLKSLIQAGLSTDQALVYETLIQNGPMQASRLHRKMSLSRPLIYKVLGDLQGLGLVEKDETKSAVALFVPAHPLKLKEMLDKKFEAAQNAKVALDGTISQLISNFNLVSGKPGIRFFEGLEGVKEVLNDSLTTKTEILSYADLESIEKYIPDINKRYVQAREKNNIKKKGLIIDSPFAREFLKNYAQGVTNTRLLAHNSPPFHTVMQIYDGKISYITLSEENLIGVIVADRRIYEMHLFLFEHLWSITPEFDQKKAGGPTPPAPSQKPKDNAHQASEDSASKDIPASEVQNQEQLP